MLVRRKRSNKRKRKFYEALEFIYDSNIKDIEVFLNNLGEIKCNSRSVWIETRDGQKICTGQFLLKDDRKKKIISFDLTTFYEFYDIWNI